jgi:hypothetical protein
MLQLCQVVGLQEHLTVPSRNQTHLVDVWVTIVRCGPDENWDIEFGEVALQKVARLSPSGAFHIVSMNDQRGWIVARRVDRRLISPRDVESLVRDIVERVNARATLRTGEIVVQDFRLSWVHRMRASIASAGTALAGKRARRDADVASTP